MSLHLQLCILPVAGGEALAEGVPGHGARARAGGARVPAQQPAQGEAVTHQVLVQVI